VIEAEDAPIERTRAGIEERIENEDPRASRNRGIDRELAIRADECAHLRAGANECFVTDVADVVRCANEASVLQLRAVAMADQGDGAGMGLFEVLRECDGDGRSIRTAERGATDADSEDAVGQSERPGDAACARAGPHAREGGARRPTEHASL
jgi:hypothetical protein